MKTFPIACVVVGVIATAADPVMAQGGKPKTGCGNDVSLAVTVSGTQSAPAGYALVADGLGEYRDGAKGAAKVSAHFQVSNCTHDFTTNLASSTRSMWALLSNGDQRAWFFNFDRVHSVPVTPQNQLDSQVFVDSHPFCTGGVKHQADGQILKNAEGWYYDNYGGCGIDESGRAFVRRGGGISLDPDDRLSFRVSPIDRPQALCVISPEDPTCGASFLRVYHPDANTWVVRPEPLASASHSVWTGSDGYVFAGHETVPFEVTAVRK